VTLILTKLVDYTKTKGRCKLIKVNDIQLYTKSQNEIIWFDLFQ